MADPAPPGPPDFPDPANDQQAPDGQQPIPQVVIPPLPDFALAADSLQIEDYGMQVLQQLRLMNDGMNTRFDAMDARFDAMDARLGAMNQRIDSRDRASRLVNQV
ncbi:hypothetical protein N7495_005697 [Penicillium taxi]|uniref:uncharacterized protein n=1 Tax=Penicillium taxi TaxID=168475 RepID=UPI002545B81A|nr:uncharacterized protein N7495_005697 [Penicillium taxi]KAJ5894006.1 hypothetical protein N7495_005697 [Penicillium taxi]